MKKNILSFPYYLFVFPLFYVLNLYSINIGEVGFDVTIRPVFILFLIALAFLGLFHVISRNSRNASFLAFLWLFFLLFYGRVYLYLKVHPIFGMNLGHHVIFGAVWILLFLVISVLIVSKRIKFSNNVNIFMNFVTVLLLISSTYSVLHIRKQYSLNSTGQNGSNLALSKQQTWLKDVSQPLASSEALGKLPDIYYIIPDMFTRGDALLAETGYDNSAFIKELKKLGFYVAECSRSNYASTQLSIASSLNMSYLDQIQDGMTDRVMLVEPMSDSLVRSSLEALGYSTVVLENGFGLPELHNPAITISTQTKFFLCEPYNPFESLIVNNSFLRIFYDVNFGPLSRMYDKLFFPYTAHVLAQKTIFDQLPNIAPTDGPKFVFAHIMMPHPPFLIHADGTVETDSRYYREALGQPVTEELYLQGYLMQAEYVQNRLPDIIKQILAESETDPIIIIQGDHGIRDGNRLDILNAYYVPKSIQEKLYQNITPVNTFRVIFDNVFGTNYGLLPDKSWYSVYPEWFDMQISAEHNPGCTPK